LLPSIHKVKIYIKFYISFNELNKKFYFLSQTNPNSKICNFSIFDIDEEKCFEKNLFLRIISNLVGFSQINLNNSLYLCGSNNEESNEGSYLMKFDYNYSTPFILVNSIYSHFFPSLIGFKENLVVVGGKENVFCEIYYEKNSKWKEIAKLPSDRFKCNLISDEKNNFIYLFGGYTKISKKNCNNILRLNMNNFIWENILINNNEFFLERNSSLLFSFNDHIFICGGFDNNNEKTEYIIQFNITKRKVKKFYEKLKKNSAFDVTFNVDNFSVGIDNDGYIHTISKNFRLKLINFEENCIQI
jgi:hypothetical protein